MTPDDRIRIEQRMAKMRAQPHIQVHSSVYLQDVECLLKTVTMATDAAIEAAGSATKAREGTE